MSSRLSVKLLRLLQNYPPPEDPGVRGRLNECLETILNKAQEPPKSKKVQHSNAKNSVLFEAISLIIHNDRYKELKSASGLEMGGDFVPVKGSLVAAMLLIYGL